MPRPRKVADVARHDESRCAANGRCCDMAVLRVGPHHLDQVLIVGHDRVGKRGPNLMDPDRAFDLGKDFLRPEW